MDELSALGGQFSMIQGHEPTPVVYFSCPKCPGVDSISDIRSLHAHELISHGVSDNLDVVKEDNEPVIGN